MFLHSVFLTMPLLRNSKKGGETGNRRQKDGEKGGIWIKEGEVGNDTTYFPNFGPLYNLGKKNPDVPHPPPPQK